MKAKSVIVDKLLEVQKGQSLRSSNGSIKQVNENQLSLKSSNKHLHAMFALFNANGIPPPGCTETPAKYNPLIRLL